MPRGDKSSYSPKQRRQAEHIEEGYEKRGVSKKTAQKRAWATVNKQDGGAKGGRPVARKSAKKASAKKSPARKKAPAKRTAKKSATKKAAGRRGSSSRSAAAKKAARTRARNKR